MRHFRLPDDIGRPVFTATATVQPYEQVESQRHMATTPEPGFLVIADLTGYTSYLSRSELEHAPAIAGDLPETILGRLDPPFRLAAGAATFER